MTAEEFSKRSNDIIDEFKNALTVARTKFAADVEALQAEVNASNISEDLQKSIVLGMFVKMEGIEF